MKKLNTLIFKDHKNKEGLSNDEMNALWAELGLFPADTVAPVAKAEADVVTEEANQTDTNMSWLDNCLQNL